MGLREIKKNKTRKNISDIATRLFIKKGYNEVTIADIAAEAEVSLKTVFNYFPKKETLVFDIEDELDSEIQSAVRDRKAGQTLLEALHQCFLTSNLFNPSDKKGYGEFMKLVHSSPELSAYFRVMMGRYENTLSRLIREESGADKLEADCLARLIIEGVSFAHSATPREEALRFVFGTLNKGWIHCLSSGVLG